MEKNKHPTGGINQWIHHTSDMGKVIDLSQRQREGRMAVGHQKAEHQMDQASGLLKDRVIILSD